MIVCFICDCLHGVHENVHVNVSAILVLINYHNFEMLVSSIVQIALCTFIQENLEIFSNGSEVYFISK